MVFQRLPWFVSHHPEGTGIRATSTVFVYTKNVFLLKDLPVVN